MINANPNSIPMIPNFCIRSSDVLEISDMIDWMILILPPVIPLTILDNRYSQIFWVSTNTTNDIIVPITHSSSMGLRPYLSDNCPNTGADKKANNEYADKPNVIQNGEL